MLQNQGLVFLGQLVIVMADAWSMGCKGSTLLVVFWHIKGVGRQHEGEADPLEVRRRSQYLSGSLDFKFSIGLQLSETGIPVSKWAIKEAC